MRLFQKFVIASCNKSDQNMKKNQSYETFYRDLKDWINLHAKFQINTNNTKNSESHIDVRYLSPNFMSDVSIPSLCRMSTSHLRRQHSATRILCLYTPVWVWNHSPSSNSDRASSSSNLGLFPQTWGLGTENNWILIFTSKSIISK